MKRDYYWVSPDVAIIRLDDGNILFKSDTLAIKIESDSVSLLIEKIIPLLDGHKSIHEIASMLDVPETSLTPHLDILAEKGILRADAQKRNHTSNFDNFLHNANRDAAEAKQVLHSFTVAIVGLEGEGVLLARSLLSSGIKNLVVADPFLPVQENGLLLNEYKTAAGKLSRQEILAETLKKDYPECNIQPGPDSITKESVHSMVNKADLIVCCFDKNFMAASYWVNAACVHSRKPVIFSTVNGHISMVGPLVIPGQTACFMCYKMRSLTNKDDFEMAIAAEKYLNNGREPSLHNKAFLHGAINYNCSILANEILKYIFTLGAPILASHVIEFNNIDLTTANHYVMQMPECKVCKKKATRSHPDLTRLHAESVYRSDISAYEKLLVSGKTGVVSKFGVFQKDISEPSKPYIFRADLSNHRFLKKQDLTDNIASGKGLTEKKAKISALGEAVERYSGACYDDHEIIYATYHQIDKDKLNPQDLVLFANEQYITIPYKTYTHDTVLGWVNAYSLLKEQSIFIPAISVFMNYKLHSEDENICPITSNGLAAGNTLLHSILSAAMEIIERDAFIISWHNKLPCKKINPLSMPDDKDLQDYIIAYKRRGVELMLFALPTDFPCHVFLAIGIQSVDEGPYAVVGLGADFNAMAAAKSALLEVGQVRPSLKKRLRQTDTKEKLAQLLKDPTRVHELDDHDLLYASKDSAPRLEFLLHQPEELYSWENQKYEDAEKLQLLLDHIKAIGSDLIYYNLTPADMEKLGLYTSRVIIPTLQPIHFGYNNIRLGGSRLFNQAQNLGFSKNARSVSELDLTPHPLA